MNSTSNIGRKARRTFSGREPHLKKGYTFTITKEDEVNRFWTDQDGHWHCIENCELVNEPTREPIKPGTYGIVQIFIPAPFQHGGFDIRIPPVHATAEELREAAHLFNQLAEQLEAPSTADLVHDKSENSDRIKHLINEAHKEWGNPAPLTQNIEKTICITNDPTIPIGKPYEYNNLKWLVTGVTQTSKDFYEIKGHPWEEPPPLTRDDVHEIVKSYIEDVYKKFGWITNK